MVNANLGVSIVPKLVVPSDAAVKRKVLSLGPDTPARVLGLAYHKQHVQLRAIDELYLSLQKVIADSWGEPEVQTAH